MISYYDTKLNISYEPPDKRRFYRLAHPVKVIIDSIPYKTVNWSVSAFKVENYRGNLAVGDINTVEIEINFQGFTVKFYQKVKVLRIEPENNALIAEYIETSPRNREILSYFSQGLITGELHSFDEVIRHLDIPINDSYINYTFLENPPAKKSSFCRTSSMFIYILLGLTLALYVLNSYYTHVYLLQVDSAVVAGKTELINSPSKGIISKIHIREGDSITRGEPLFQISNPEAEKEIEEKKNQILKNRAILKEHQRQLKNLQSKLENYKKNFSFKLSTQEKIIGSLKEKLDLLNDELEKKTAFYKRKLVSKPEIDRLKKEIIGLEQKLAAANYEYYHIYENIQNPESGTNDEIHKKEDSENLKAEIERIKETIRIDEKELSYIKFINGKNTMKAPFKAVLGEIFAFEGKYVDEKTPILLLKDTSGKKFVEARLSEKDALKLRLGLEVKIEVPSQDIRLKGKLIRLEKRQEFPGKSLIIALIEPENPGLLKPIRDGTPVKVEFRKKKVLK